MTSSNLIVKSSDPNLVLTNPEIQKHLRELHENAKLKGSLVFDDNFIERKQLLLTKLKAYNRRSEIGAFKVKISESPDNFSYSGPIKFYYQAIGSTREICRVVSLSDHDCVKTILPNLRQKFKIDEDVRCTLCEQINGDEILLDPDDRPLELAVNSKYPATFHLVPGTNRNTELLTLIQSEQFTPEQRRKLIEKPGNINNAILDQSAPIYNLRSEDDSGSVTSSNSTPRHCTSMSSSSTNEGARQFPLKTDPSLNETAMSRNNGKHHNDLRRKASMKENSVLSTTLSLPTRSNSLPKSDRLRCEEHNQPGASSALPPTGTQSTRVGRVRHVKHKKGEAMSRRASRSASARKLFRSLRKYRGRSSSRERARSRSPQADDAESTTGSELSIDANAPGILKIFGDAVSPGANYKSVMATKSSTAKELVKIVIERYGLSKQDYTSHVLCEVVGKLSENSKGKGLQIKTRQKKKKGSVKSVASDVEFKEEYVRPLMDQEKPLVLQSYWKPQDGLCRRFEIRRRSKVFKQIEKDHSTRGINSQAKRLVLQKSKTTSNLPLVTNKPDTDDESEEEKITSFDSNLSLDNSHSESSNQDLNDVEKDKEAQIQENTLLEANISSEKNVASLTESDKVELSAKDTLSSNHKTRGGAATPSNNNPPCPYLITLQGNEENLIHSLDKAEVLIGSDAMDIKLVAPDVSSHHCVIKKRLEVVFSEKENYETIKRWCVSITPLQTSSDIRINGSKISAKHPLKHGEMVSIGKHHLFMYKDPSCHLDLSTLVNLSYLTSNKDGDNSSTEAHGSNTSINSLSSPHNKSTRKVSDLIETLINFESEQQNGILDEIFHLAYDVNDSTYKHAPANLLCHCILHSCLNFPLQTKSDLLLKIASTLQTFVLNATRNVSMNEVKSYSDSLEPSSALLASLQPVVFWMSNSLEVFGFLQHDLQTHLKDKVKEETEKKNLDSFFLLSIADFVVNDEILALLEEVVMYAFQQVVYYLTKTLYGCLPAILESNPFADDTSQSVSVTQITNVFSQAHQLMMKYDVNRCISEQLFAYLFFFTNISLFNTLMEEGSSKYYKWEMGIRMRGNLEFLESWADENGFIEECVKHLEKITALANLLATPRSQIMKGSWTSFRQNFSALTPVQLQRVLNGYRMPSNQSRPSSWRPTADEEFPESCEADSTLESYDNHPPLMLSVSGSRINLNHLPDNPQLRTFYKRIERLGARIEDPYVMSDGMDTARREQGDGRELSKSETVMSPEQKPKSMASSTDEVKIYFENAVLSKSKNTSLAGQDSSKADDPLSCSSSSEPEAYLAEKSLFQPPNNPTASRSVNQLLDEEDGNELVVLPISETTSVHSRVAQNRTGLLSPQSSSSKSSQDEKMPKEVFIVDIKRSRTGLGVGLIDGLATSLVSAGVYVRSLIPDNPSTKHSPTKHHDVIRCWLQEGRLQLGDRILAANGISLISMSYYEAIKTIRQAGENVRLLVGRCGNDIALKITTSSC